VAELGKVTFLGCTHANIWALDTQEGACVKKVGLASLKKLDWIHINEPLVKELICSFNDDNQYVKLQGRQIDIGEEGIVKVFKLPCKGLMAGAQEGFDGVDATYFVRTQQDHYVIKSRYLIAQVNGKVRVRRLKTLTEILTFRQSNNFAPGFLVSMMLVAEKELANWVAWFSQKLQNELVVVQRKARKLISTLVGPTLTIIEYYYQELFVKE
jgi:hypothetical protein